MHSSGMTKLNKHTSTNTQQPHIHTKNHMYIPQFLKSLAQDQFRLVQQSLQPQSTSATKLQVNLLLDRSTAGGTSLEHRDNAPYRWQQQEQQQQQQQRRRQWVATAVECSSSREGRWL
jgi:hypothetical protein